MLPARFFTGILIFKVFTARHLYKSFSVKGLKCWPITHPSRYFRGTEPFTLCRLQLGYDTRAAMSNYQMPDANFRVLCKVFISYERVLRFRHSLRSKSPQCRGHVLPHVCDMLQYQWLILRQIFIKLCIRVLHIKTSNYLNSWKNHLTSSHTFWRA
jgi:hypothetical protein